MAELELPRWIASLLSHALPARTADAVLGDLTEDYANRVMRDGASRARRWAAREAGGILLAYCSGRLAGSFSPVRAAREFFQPRGASRDLRQAVRGLRRSPGFALLASLTLGAGLATVVITLGFIDALVLRPISSSQPETLRRLVIVERDGRQTLRVSNVERERILEATGDDFTIAGASLQPALVQADNRSFQTLAEVVSANYFSVLGARAVHGRLLVHGDAAPGAAPVAVMSDAWWRRLGRPPDVLGRAIKINGAPFTIIGVAPPVGTSSSLGASVDVWVALSFADSLMSPGWRTRVDERWFTLLMRLGRQANEVAADAALARARNELDRTLPDPWRERRLITAPPTLLVGSQRTTAMRLAGLLAGLAALALAVVSANVAALFFVRGAAGRRAAAIRLSLGAARAAVLRQALLEGVLLSLAASVCALALYASARRWFADVTILPTLSLRLELPWDASLVAITIGLAVCGGIALAWAPAWWLARVQVDRALRDQSGPITGGASLPRIRRVLIAAQMAAALVLAVQGALLARTASVLSAADIGVASDRLLAMDLDLEPAQGMDHTALSSRRLVEDMLVRVRALPGVASVALASRAPVDSSTPALDVARSGDGPEVRLRDVTFYKIGPGYFETIGLPLVRGRAFLNEDLVERISERSWTDQRPSTTTSGPFLRNGLPPFRPDIPRDRDVVIVNETLSRQLWGDVDPIDRSVRLEPEGRLVRVIGVARDSRYRSLTETPRPHLYLPTPPGFGLALLVRSTGAVDTLPTAVQQVLDSVGPGVQGFFPRTHRHHLAFDLLPLRTAARAAIVVGLAAATLCLIGLYGLLAWLVQMRRAEIGVRLALGARSSDIVWLVVGQGMRAALPGLAAGIVLALAATRVAGGAVAGVTASDPIAYLAAVLVLSFVVICASWLPARRAVAIDPSEALRRG